MGEALEAFAAFKWLLARVQAFVFGLLERELFIN